jgi:hypothetical protein
VKSLAVILATWLPVATDQEMVQVWLPTHYSSIQQRRIKTMAKIYGLHEVKLRPGVKGEELERFFRDEVSSVARVEGWDAFLLKKYYGTADIEYLLAWVIDEERHPKVFPEIWTEIDQWQEDNADLWEKWKGLMDVVGEDHAWADYRVVE